MPMIPAVLYVERNRDLLRLGTLDVERGTPRIWSEPMQPEDDFPVMVVHADKPHSPTEVEFMFSHWDMVNREAVYVHEAGNKNPV